MLAKKARTVGEGVRPGVSESESPKARVSDLKKKSRIRRKPRRL